jgi:hypothetical protein
MSLTPLYVPPSRPSPRPPGEPLHPPEKSFGEQNVLHRRAAAAVDAERLRLAEERRALEREKAEFARQRQARCSEQTQTQEPKRRVDVDPIHKLDVLPTDAKALAVRIIEMGRVRRAEISYRGIEPTLPMAKAIIAAAAKARSTAPPPALPEHPLAKAIVLCGQKARGTIDAAGERWLADYFGKMEATRELMR